MSLADVFELVNQLPLQEREDLAFKILNSLPAGAPPSPIDQKGLVATINQRMEDLSAGKAKSVDLPEAMKRIRGG